MATLRVMRVVVGTNNIVGYSRIVVLFRLGSAVVVFSMPSFGSFMVL